MWSERGENQTSLDRIASRMQRVKDRTAPLNSFSPIEDGSFFVEIFTRSKAGKLRGIYLGYLRKVSEDKTKVLVESIVPESASWDNGIRTIHYNPRRWFNGNHPAIARSNPQLEPTTIHTPGVG